nr:unnamed protein product [Callosobruchus chinensis]
MAAGGGSLEDQFVLFSKFGDTKADGKTITLTQIDKWFKQASIFDKRLTTTDTAISFGKLKSKTITCKDFCSFIDDLANQKKIPADEIKDKLVVSCGQPGMTKARLHKR